MARVFRVAILMACILSAGSAFAAGGACPAGTPVAGSNNCYFVAANGSDSNSGTSESAPWLHAPGMPNCTGNCGSVTPGPGAGFIFRGGDTWHFGNGTAPYTGGTWSFPSSGSAGSPIYIGVDQSWHSGSSWARPILNADNPVSASTALGPCAYQVGSGNDFVTLSNYDTFDNFEMLGFCSEGAGSFGTDVYVSPEANDLVENLYVHGWTHQAFNCTAGSPPTGQCNDIYVFLSGAGPNTYQGIVIDGSDSDPAGAGVCYCDAWDMHNNVWRYVSQIVGRNCHLFYDNLLDYWYDPGDGEAHGNTYECVGEASGSNASWNNVIRNNYLPGAGTGVGYWIGPSAGTTDYVFNQVFYNNYPANGNYFNIQNPGNMGTVYVWNSTFQTSQSSGLISCQGASHTYALNLHLITEAGSPYYNSSSCNISTNLFTNNTTANGAGYSSSEMYAYSASSTSSTVGAGTNEQALCTMLSNAGLSLAASACQSDTGYACAYNSSNHTVSCPEKSLVARPSAGAPDIGAYQYSGVSVVPPTGLSATVQ